MRIMYVSTQIDLILSDEVCKEISSLQGILSERDGRKWSFSETCHELIRFCMDGAYSSSESKNALLLKRFFEKNDKSLKELQNRILMSSMFEDFYKMNC